MERKEILQALHTELARPIYNPFVRAVREFSLLRPGDRVAVCISGGKDSALLGLLLDDYAARAGLEVRFLAMDPGYPAENRRQLEENMARLGLPLTVFETDVLRVAGKHAPEHPCFLCAKLRRGALHDAALAAGCKKVALGHHFDDVVETYMLSLMYEGRISCFKPVTYLDRRGITLIRPLLYTPEHYIRSFARREALPIVHNPCPADGNTKRQEVKDLLRTLEKDNHGLRERIFGAIQRYPLDGWEPDRERYETK